MKEVWLEPYTVDPYGGFWACSKECPKGPRIFTTEEDYLKYAENGIKNTSWGWSDFLYLGIKDKEGKFSLTVPRKFSKNKETIPGVYLTVRSDEDRSYGSPHCLYRSCAAGGGGVYRDEESFLNYLRTYQIPKYVIGKALEYLGIKDKEGKFSRKTPLLVTAEEPKQEEIRTVKNYEITGSEMVNVIPANKMEIGQMGTIMRHSAAQYVGAKVIMLVGGGGGDGYRLQSLTNPSDYWLNMSIVDFPVRLLEKSEKWEIVGR